MAQDLRKLFEEERRSEQFLMEDGHEARFLERLEENLPEKMEGRSTFFFVRIAAAVIVLMATTIFFVFQNSSEVGMPSTLPEVTTANVNPSDSAISLGDLSPDLQKIEAYYVSNINFELSQLDVSEAYKDMVDGFMQQLADLDKEYRLLNDELNDLGPNDETIAALIQNLQLRLQLLQKLKGKINQLKSSKNEQETHII